MDRKNSLRMVSKVVARRSMTRNGVTMVELLVVFAIIGILASVLLPAVQFARARTSQLSRCESRATCWMSRMAWVSNSTCLPAIGMVLVPLTLCRATDTAFSDRLWQSLRSCDQCQTRIPASKCVRMSNGAEPHLDSRSNRLRRIVWRDYPGSRTR